MEKTIFSWSCYTEVGTRNLEFQKGIKGPHGNCREQHLCPRLLEQNDYKNVSQSGGI